MVKYSNRKNKTKTKKRMQLTIIIVLYNNNNIFVCIFGSTHRGLASRQSPVHCVFSRIDETLSANILRVDD